MSHSQTEILARIRRAQHSSMDAADVQLALASLGEAPPAPQDCVDPEENFFMRLLRSKASLEIASNRSEAVKLISEFLYREHNTRKVVAGHEARLAAMPWRDGGVLVRFDTANAEDSVSISFAKLAIAESGTLVLFSGRDNPASNNYLVQDHLVIVDAADLVADYEQAWPVIRSLYGNNEIPRVINFISAPSSTADIALHSVLGAHGPQRLHVIYIGEVTNDLLVSAQEKALTLKA